VSKVLHGTLHDDTLVGSSTEENIFLEVGLGRDVATGGQHDDVFRMLVDEQVDKVDGGAGEDTIDYSESDRGLHINLATGVVTAEFSVPGTSLAVAHEVTSVKNVEDVVGSRFDDTIIGTSGDNRIDGGGGDDTIHAGAGNDTLIGGAGNNLLDGGSGTDTVDYSGDSHHVFVDLKDGIGGEFDSMTMFGPVLLNQDTYVSIENITGSAQTDLLLGDSHANVIDGGGGDDLIVGFGGNDTLHGGNGDDRVFSDGNVGDTVAMFGDDGNDTLFGSAARDIMDGGSGSDWVDYSAPPIQQGETGSPTGVIVDLSSGTGYGGWAEGDTYVNIENARGTAHDDVIIGDGNANILDGAAGNNIVHGGGGDDTLMGNGQLFGDDGNDTLLNSDSGTTFYDGGAGIDTVDYSRTDDRVVVDLAGALAAFGVQSGKLDANGNHISIDSYASIENVEGGQNNDLILADNNANVLDGNDGNDLVLGFGGNDTINGGRGDDMIEGGAGADHLDGGSGVNTLSYELSTARVVVNLANATASGGDANGDVISNFQNVAGSNHDDVLIGSNGNNLLFEQAGHNFLVGGGGQDTFAFSSFLTGSNFVTDFHVGEDKIAIVGSDSMQDLHVTQTATGTLITFDNTSGAIMLAGVNAQNFVQHESTEIVFSQTLDPLLHG
jgi:Ca2+-binding RTX toxin-like protein